MFLLEPNETPYDLRFGIFGIPVRVHPMFWLVSAVLGWGAIHEGPQFVIAWVAVLFVSILIHELGHVLAGRVFGSEGRIVLYSFGGLAVGSNRLNSRTQRILVCLAGPAAGFLLLAVVLVAAWVHDPAATRGQIFATLWGFGIPVGGLADRFDIDQYLNFLRQNPLIADILRQLIFVNLFWGLMNLMPIWPLDGGQISRDVFEGVSLWKGTSRSLIVSIAFAAVFAAYFLIADFGHEQFPFLPLGSRYAALMFGLLAYQSYQMLEQIRRNRRFDDPWR